MKRKDFSYTYNSRGYMIAYKGHNIGGVGIIGAGPRGRGATAQAKEYAKHAEDEIKSLLQGAGWLYLRDKIAEIDGTLS